MIRIRSGMAAALLAAWAASAGTARADYFTYSDSVAFNGSSIAGTAASGAVVTYADGNSITLSPNSVTGTPYLNGQGGGTDIVLGGISIVASDGSYMSDGVAATYTFTLTLTDYATQSSTAAEATQVFTISGTLGGSFGGFAAGIVNTYDGVNSTTTSPFAVSVSPPNFTPPGPRTSGTFGAHVLASSFTGTSVPEPGSMTLLGLGLAGAAAVSRRGKGLRASA